MNEYGTLDGSIGASRHPTWRKYFNLGFTRYARMVLCCQDCGVEMMDREIRSAMPPHVDRGHKVNKKNHD
jgi:hypothetical protein